MVEFVLFCLPAVLYVLVQSRRPEQSAADARRVVGVTWGPASGYGWAVLVLGPVLLAAWLATVLIPAGVLDTPGVAIARLTSVAAGVGVVLRAAGEEVLFRGLLAGVLARRLGPVWGNLAQAAAFLVPHLPLLLVDPRTWPILPVQFAAGWLLGLLRLRTGSVLPGTLVHAVSNLAAGLIAT